MAPLRVAFIDVGEHLPLSLSKLAEQLNSLQSSFAFETAATITADVLGEPAIDDDWYDVPRIFKLISTNVVMVGFDFAVGVTNSKITNSTELGTKPEKDYFSQSDFNKLSIVSVNKRVLVHNSLGKNTNQYASFLIICELLLNFVKHNISHLGQDPCLFNECVDRANLGECIDSAKICPACIANLKKHNVSDRLLTDVQTVLNWCSRNTWRYAAANTLQHPIPSLGLGTGLGWLSSIFLTKEYYPIIVAATVLPTAIVFLSRKYSVHHHES